VAVVAIPAVSPASEVRSAVRLEIMRFTLSLLPQVLRDSFLATGF